MIKKQKTQKLKYYSGYLPVLPSVLRDKVYEYKLNHLKLGKLVRHKNGPFSVKSNSWDIQWQTNRVLAVVIRDYLRSFIAETPAIGNVVINDVPDAKHRGLTEEAERIYDRRWKELVSRTSDEFDDLANQLGFYGSAEASTEKQISETAQRAFRDLAVIFEDLCW